MSMFGPADDDDEWPPVTLEQLEGWAKRLEADAPKIDEIIRKLAEQCAAQIKPPEKKE